ncbi:MULTISPECIES: DUF262 domain-containing protein [Staphylococcus]|uniref:DUF262 domain-containing protein n=1 Tax=Staphylococcus TaxID=1279 RepID=UPI001013C7AF|nr:MULTISPECIES: DUF1524 domain-containing protein [Staphylococcus]MBN6202942.1 DUF262 domain-containing protein [Staphylococcus saprophyticus]MDK9858059.1 DUF262 domain-containing HNH endonuclease family protein [Staphylococcus equorum]MDK9875119.1 DUF262 domain-containing HNH endonuclease family protein [Staphylococcus equorum]RXS02289.1 DUF262 domain-containing protein [Staphylococcus saprophyticus]
MDSLLKADDKKLNEYLLLSNGKFNIPYTQRPYEWSNSHVERLFNDVIAVHEEKKEQHILNFITIYLEDDHQNIFDGQQRTVTLLLIICAIINKIYKIGDSKSAQKLKEEFIKKDDWRSNSANNTKIIFGRKETNTFFEEYVINDNTELTGFITDHEKHLQKNYDYIKDLVDNYYTDNNLNSKDLLRIVENMTEKMYVIILETPNEDIANQMFETLNNTGKKLVDFYVLKNKCVKITSEKETAKFWDEIEANTDLLNKNQFLTQFVSIYNGKTSSQKAFETLENNGWLETSSSVKNVLYDMQKVSRYFFELHEPEQRKNNNDSKSDLKIYIELVEGLKTLNSVQYRPLILAMNLKDYDLKSINKVLKICLNIQVRNIFIAQQKANTLENLYPDLARKIYSNSKEILPIVIQDLQTKIISDQETIVAASNRYINSSEFKKIRYILKAIYDFDTNKEITINGDSEHVNLEHILPQNPKDESLWIKNFKTTNISNYINNLGNLTLILGKKNTSLGNKEFTEKRLKLKDSNIKHNMEIAKNESWTRKEIEERAQKLANKITCVWPK